jgi:hypothetical protein
MWRTLKFKIIFIVITIIQIFIASIRYLAPEEQIKYLAMLPSFLGDLIGISIYLLYLPPLYLLGIIAFTTGFIGKESFVVWLIILYIPFILIYSFIFTKIVLWAWGKFSKQNN